MENKQLSELLFSALENNNRDQIQAICADDMQANQNHGPNMGVDELLAFNQSVQKVVKNFRYENAIRSSTESGFVEEHNVCGTLPNGEEMNLAVCVVTEVTNGKISMIREYADSRAASGLLKALNA